MIKGRYWGVIAVCEHIVPNNSLPCGDIHICVNKPRCNWIIIPTLQIVEPGFLVIDMPTIPQRIQLRQSTHHGNDVAPCIVSILGYCGSGGGFHRHYVALQVGDVIVDGAIVSHGQRRAVGIVAEIQNVVPNGHPHQLVTGIDVAVGLVVAYPSGAQAAGVVLHLPVPRIQLHRGDPGAAHVAVGVGDEAAILRSIACRCHIHPEGAGGLAGQILKIAGSRSPAQPIVAQVCAFGFHDEGSSVARSAIVVGRLIDNGELRIKFADSRNPADDRQFVRLGSCGMARMGLLWWHRTQLSRDIAMEAEASMAF